MLGGRGPGWSWRENFPQALGFTVHLVYSCHMQGHLPQRHSGRELAGTSRPLLASVLLRSPGLWRRVPDPPVSAPCWEHVRLLCQHVRQGHKSPLHKPQACDISLRMGTFSPLGSTGRWQLRGATVVAKVTAHDDSSSPGPCTFRRGVEGAPCSGQTRPGHQVSPGVSAKKGRKGPKGGGENLQLQR